MEIKKRVNQIEADPQDSAQRKRYVKNLIASSANLKPKVFDEAFKPASTLGRFSE